MRRTDRPKKTESLGETRSIRKSVNMVVLADGGRRFGRKRRAVGPKKMKMFSLGRRRSLKNCQSAQRDERPEERPPCLGSDAGARMLIAAEAGTVGDRRLAHVDHAAVARIKACEHVNFVTERCLRRGQLASEHRATGCEREGEGLLHGLAFLTLGTIAHQHTTTGKLRKQPSIVGVSFSLSASSSSHPGLSGLISISAIRRR